MLSIYDNSGNPYMGGRSYPIPGPRPITCSAGGSSNGGSSTPSNGGGSGSVPLYGQCGGSAYTGPTSCAQGTCKAQNEWYSQCTP